MRIFEMNSTALKIIGAIVVGVIGSALWDSVLKPALPWVGTLLLNIATLGLHAARDGLYAEMAEGITERAALNTFEIVIWTATAAAFIFVFEMLKGAERKAALKKNLEKSSLPELQAQITKLRKAIVRGCIFLALCVGVLVIMSIRIVFIDSGAVHVAQYQRVVGPYLTEQQRLSIASRFAQMKSREDYDAVISDLDKISKAHNLRVPHFLAF